MAQCKARTARGTQCSRPAAAPSRSLCGTHQRTLARGTRVTNAATGRGVPQAALSRGGPSKRAVAARAMASGVSKPAQPRGAAGGFRPARVLRRPDTTPARPRRPDRSRFAGRGPCPRRSRRLRRHALGAARPRPRVRPIHAPSGMFPARRVRMGAKDTTTGRLTDGWTPPAATAAPRSGEASRASRHRPSLDLFTKQSVHGPTMDADTPTLPALVETYLTRCVIEGKSPRTVQAYRESLERFCRCLREDGAPLDPDALRPDHVIAYLVRPSPTASAPGFPSAAPPTPTAGGESATASSSANAPTRDVPSARRPGRSSPRRSWRPSASLSDRRG